MSYRGYSYWGVLDNRIGHWIWRKLFCRIGWHLWDEVYSPEEHYLYCDACDEEVGISETPDELIALVPEPNELTEKVLEETENGIDLHSAMTLDELFKELNR